MPKNRFIFVFILFGNLWIWKIFLTNFYIALLLIIATDLLYLFSKNNKLNKKIIFAFLLILFYQYVSTNKINLTGLSDDQQRIQQMRLGEYPSKYLKIGYYFENRRESIAFFRIQNNLSEILDPNLYFFASHPRQRIGVDGFEKFPYIYLPFFILGVFLLIKQKKKLFFINSLLIPILLLSIIGSNNSIGAFALFPFIVISTTTGAENYFKNKNIKYFKLFILITTLILIQMYSYEIF